MVLMLDATPKQTIAHVGLGKKHWGSQYTSDDEVEVHVQESNGQIDLAPSPINCFYTIHE